MGIQRDDGLWHARAAMGRQLAVLAALTGASLVTLGAGVAYGQSANSTAVTGHWAGFSAGANIIDNTRLAAPFSLDVHSQAEVFAGNDERVRFRGEVRGLGTESAIPVDGLIAADGQMTMAGQSEAVLELVIEGRARRLSGRGMVDPGDRALLDLGDRALLDPGDLEGRYLLTLRDGTSASGQLVAVHQVPDPDAPSFAGGWQGSARALLDPEYQVAASFSQDRGGAISGAWSWQRSVDDPLVFDLAGQAFVHPGTDGVVLAGGADDALILAALEQSASGPGLAGSYRMWVSELGAAGSRFEDGEVTMAPSTVEAFDPTGSR